METRSDINLSGSDFSLANHGTIFILTPLTADATDWTDTNLPAGCLQWAGGLAIEHRYIRDILTGLCGDGLSFETE